MSLKKIQSMQELLKSKNLTMVIVPTQDYHMSEYVGEYFKSRAYLSGFSGSAGTLLVTTDGAYLWTDGRYFIQAEKEIQGLGINLMKAGMPSVPTISEFIKNTLKANDTLCFDGRVLSINEGNEYKEIAKSVGATILSTEDLVDGLWNERPTLSKEPAYLLNLEQIGQSASDKIARVRKIMQENNADLHIIGSLDEVAWLYNIRGNDVENTPLLMSFAVIDTEKAYLFAIEETINDEVRNELEKQGIEVRAYDEIYKFISTIDKDRTVMLDKDKLNFAIKEAINANIIFVKNPTYIMKAIKNEVELNNTRIAHIKDGVAITKLMHWIKTNVGKIPMNEVDIETKVFELRSEQDGFMDISFDSIVGYKEHAAMIHYHATEDIAYDIKAESMLLIDSGGHYTTGTTDITRTFILGDITEEEKRDFTCVLKGVINLSNAKFLYGCNGINLDILARGALWQLGIDYRCGTGHGVGHLSVIHEGPNGFRWKIVPERNDSGVLEAGMITTIEPGVYTEGSHGIRIENELICQKSELNEYGQFMNFETITFAPIDIDGIDTSIMTKTEIEWLNSYHKAVFEKISPFLNEEEKEWLKTYTRAI